MRAFRFGLAGGLVAIVLVFGVAVAVSKARARAQPQPTPRASLSQELDAYEAWWSAYAGEKSERGTYRASARFVADLNLYLARHPLLADYVEWWRAERQRDGSTATPFGQLFTDTVMPSELRRSDYLNRYPGNH